jgi:hypothetical protein
MLAVVLVGWALWVLAVRASRPRRKGLLLIPVAVAIVGLTVANTATAARSSTPETPQSRILAQFVPKVVKALPHRPGVVVVQGSSFSGGAYRAGAVLWLERNGIAVRTAEIADAAQGFGASRVYHHGPIRAVVTFASDAALDALARDPRQRLVSYVGDLPPGRRATLAAQQDALDREAKAGRISKAELLARSIVVSHKIGHATGAFLRQP